MEMVSVPLMFTRAQREVIWDLYLHSFCHMLPYFFRYDHLNYARWGSVYIAEMEQLPKEVLEEFKKGNFVVKWNESKFNQVSPDQSTPGRKDRDKKDECSLLTILKQLKVFSPPEHPSCLYNIATKDLVTDKI